MTAPERITPTPIKTRKPPRRRTSHKPGGALPNREHPESVLSALEREEKAFKERRRLEKQNSRQLRVTIKASTYLALLEICEEFARDKTDQANICLELGIKFFREHNAPYGAVRVMDSLPELRNQVVIDDALPMVPTLGEARKARESAGWMGKDAGMPVVDAPAWKPPAQELLEEEPPKFEAKTAPPEEEIVVEVEA